MQNRERKHQISIRLNDQEYEAFMESCQKSGLQTQRDFILSMCLRGYIIKIDTTGLNSVTQELHRIGVNINQIAHKVNTTGSLTTLELRNLQMHMADIYKIVKKEFTRYKNHAAKNRTID